MNELIFITVSLAAATAALAFRLKAEIARRAEAERTASDAAAGERARLGRDLHDGLCQILVSARLLAEQVKESLDAAGAPETGDAALLESRISEALGQADALSRGLFPAYPREGRLSSALEEMAAGASRLWGVECRVDAAGDVRIGEGETAMHICRIAQEAVVNAVKSGKARKIDIRLDREASRATISIADDGIGLGAAPPRRGMGLRIMEYRARLIHGFLRFESALTGGTRVICQFPIQTEGALK